MQCLRDFSFADQATQPLHEQLYQAIKERVLSNRLKPGEPLDSSRQLAGFLAVSRNTVNSALAQLAAEGYIISRRGSGHFVCDALPEQFFQSAPNDAALPESPPLPLSERAEELAAVPIRTQVSNASFQPGVPALDAFPMKSWAQIHQQHLHRSHLYGYNDLAGYSPLRQQLADYLSASRGLKLHADSVIITQGAQQAAFIAIQAVMNPGDTAYVESPGYIGMRKALTVQGMQMTGIPVNEEGLDIHQLPQNPEGKLIHLTPTHQYPMGGIMPLSHRLQLMQWAKAHRIWIIEDDYDSEYFYNHKPIAAMQGLGLANQIIYLGSFSKVLYPGLRCGYLVVPDALVDTCLRLKNACGGQSELIDQACIAEFIERGVFYKHLKKMRVLYHERQQAMIHSLQTHLADKVILHGSGSGMHLVAEFADGLFQTPQADVEVVSQLDAAGIQAAALSNYYLENPRSQGLVLGFANTPADSMDAKIQQLTKILKTATEGSL